MRPDRRKPQKSQGPRYEKAELLLRLALDMTRSSEGLSLQDIAQSYGVARRTAERMRDAILRLIPAAEEVPGDDRQKRWRIPSRDLAAITTYGVEDLATIEIAAKLCRREGLRHEATKLRDLARKLELRLPAAQLRRTQTDLEALIEAEGFAQRPGPHRAIKPELLSRLRDAMLACREISIEYRSRSSGATSRQRLQPYGLIYGNRHYLVAYSPDVVRDLKAKHGYRLFALDAILSLELLPANFTRDPSFNLARFATQSFGVFQDKPQKVELIFAAEMQSEVLAYQFHPSQIITPLRDGRVRVQIAASGMQELCWHLFTWGSAVTVVRPASLKRLYSELLKDAARAVAP